jgi:DNA-binding IclR family transcriptional regulator
VAREHENTYRVLEVSEPKKELKITVPVGTRFPLYAGALMKIFFTQMTNEDIARLVGENPPPKYTDHSVTGLGDLLGQVDQARERGYATDLEEYRKGVRGLSVLVFRGSRACGAISIFGLAGSMEDQRLPDIILHMKDAARLISRKLTLMAENPGTPDGPVDPPGCGSSEAR